MDIFDPNNLPSDMPEEIKKKIGRIATVLTSHGDQMQTAVNEFGRATADLKKKDRKRVRRAFLKAMNAIQNGYDASQRLQRELLIGDKRDG